MTTTLGFDPSLTNYGWACLDSDLQVIERGRFSTSARSLFVDRYCDLRGSVSTLVSRLGVTRVGVESPIFGESYSPGLYGLFLFTCEALREARCDVVFFSPGQAKAHARHYLGRPMGWKMMKPDMVEAAKRATGQRMNHNEADALWVARAAARFWDHLDGVLPESELTPVEAKQFAEVHTFTRGSRAGEVERSGLLYREGERFFRWSK